MRVGGPNCARAKLWERSRKKVCPMLKYTLAHERNRTSVNLPTIYNKVQSCCSDVGGVSFSIYECHSINHVWHYDHKCRICRTSPPSESAEAQCTICLRHQMVGLTQVLCLSSAAYYHEWFKPCVKQVSVECLVALTLVYH